MANTNKTVIFNDLAPDSQIMSELRYFLDIGQTPSYFVAPKPDPVATLSAYMGDSTSLNPMIPSVFGR